MSTLDKQSVREQFDAVKEKFETQVELGTVTKEVAMIFDTLIMLFGIVLSIFLERKTKKDSKNSSIPPSQTGTDESSVTQGEDSGKGRTETTQPANNTRTVETTLIAEVTYCNNCGADLVQVTCTCVERRTRIDIVFEKTVEHVDAEVKQCPSCQATVKAEFPKDMHGPLQYGNGIKAYIIQLLITQMLSLNRTSKLLASMLSRDFFRHRA